MVHFSFSLGSREGKECHDGLSGRALRSGKEGEKGRGGLTSIEEVGHPNNECESDESEKDHWIFKERHRVNCKQHSNISQDPFFPS